MTSRRRKTAPNYKLNNRVTSDIATLGTTMYDAHIHQTKYLTNKVYMTEVSFGISISMVSCLSNPLKKTFVR